MNDFSLHHNILSQAAALQQNNRFPWFPGQSTAGNGSNFQFPDFIKHAAQQQLAAQQAIKMRSEQLTSYGHHNLPIPRIEKGRRENRSDGNNEIGETPNGKKRRGNYASYTPQQRIEIGAFSIEYGTGRASKQFGLPESTARGFRDKLIKMLQENNDSLPLEQERMQRLKVLIENGHDSNHAQNLPPAPANQPAALSWHKPLMFEQKPLFQPQLDLKKEDDSELNVTKSSCDDTAQKTKIEDSNSDEDSGNSSANSSGNEDAKKHLHQMLGLDSNPLYLMRNHFLAMNARKRAFEDANSSEPQRKMIKHSSPQEQKTNQDTRQDLSVHRATPSELARRRELMRSKHAESARRELLARDRHRPLGEDEIEAELARLQALRAALYDQREEQARAAATSATLSAADRKIESVTEGQKTRSEIPLEGSVRLKGHVEMTSPPSDLSSIDGNEETEERNCHTPNSLSSDEQKNKTSSQADMSHAEASENLRLVEEALDKVVPGDSSAAKNFTGRLIGTITRTVKYVADCEKRLVEQESSRVQLEAKVVEQQQLINALSHELMKFEERQTSLLSRFDALAKQIEQPKTDVTDEMTSLVKSLREPGKLDELRASSNTQVVNLERMQNGDSLSAMIDQLGDKMAQQ